MTQGADMPWVQPQVRVSEQDGALLLENPLPLAAYPHNIGVWLRRAAALYPSKPFMLQRDADGAWKGVTYAEALARVNRLSNGMLALHLDGSRPVATLSENSVEMALFQLAAMQIGIAVTPISNAYSLLSQTGGHIQHILAVIDTPLLMLSNADLHMPKLRQWDTTHLRLFAVRGGEQHADVAPLADLASGGEPRLSAEGEARFAAVTPQTLAKIQFTSGSTSLPKGVEVTHGMLLSNQVGIAQLWPFVGAHAVVIDFLPWSHTFGGNFVSNMILMHGGSFYIDGGSPAPQGFETMVRNIVDVQPTMYFGVPRSYTALYTRMKTDLHLREAFFRRLTFMFTAAAALDQQTFDGMQAMSAEVRGAPVPFFAAWGLTETSPDATLVHWPTRDARVIGLPIPGVTIKLAPDASGKREVRVRGPNVTRGYYHNADATSRAFDAEGFLHTFDASVLLEPDNPAAGLVFDGRIGEDFKLSSGTWVHNAQLRGSINALGQPYLLEVVVAAPNRDYLAALVFPNVAQLRSRFADASTRLPDDPTFLQSDDVRGLFSDIFARHNQNHRGSSETFRRYTLLPLPPRLDQNETTDKGYINQIAVLRNRAATVDAIYAEHPAAEIVVLP